MSPIKEFKDIFITDAHRYLNDQELKRIKKGGVIRYHAMSKKMAGLHFCFWMRLCGILQGRMAWLPLYAVALNRYNHYKFKYGINIPFITQIGKGFYIGHFGCIVVNQGTIIGNNVNISQGVTIGAANRGEKAGIPAIGDEVYIGPGAKVFGAIKVGNNVAIGANAVVTHDVPDNAVVGGVPARIISMEGAKGYVNRKYEGS